MVSAQVEHQRQAGGVGVLGVSAHEATSLSSTFWKAMPEDKFPLGQTVVTHTALAVLPAQDVAAALDRHRSGDWGDVDKADHRANEHALKHGERLVSVYHTSAGGKFYIITEWDRSLTTVLLPEDY